ncbi:general stress protein 13 [Clostridiales bacterium]|nr:general stress protein 13 [Clostridiales bacterium]
MAEKIEAGSIVEGKVIRIKPFGAIVQLEDGGHGLVHISQIANGFVQDINDHVAVGDTVKVKVISIDTENKKIALSIRDALPKPPKAHNQQGFKPREHKNNYEPKDSRQPAGETAQSKEPTNDFEEKMKEWLKQSNERQAGINKRNNRRNGGY